MTKHVLRLTPEEESALVELARTLWPSALTVTTIDAQIIDRTIGALLLRYAKQMPSDIVAEQQLAYDEMARDDARETEALEWVELAPDDALDAE